MTSYQARAPEQPRFEPPRADPGRGEAEEEMANILPSEQGSDKSETATTVDTDRTPYSPDPLAGFLGSVATDITDDPTIVSE
jgi:hypothetical protein